jgi:hypothetical protein
MPQPCHNRYSSKSNFLSFIYFMADEPVSRILYDAWPCGLHRDNHSSSPDLAAGIERPTRGSSLLGEPPSKPPNACAFGVKSRASSPLLFGLAPRGVCHASAITGGAVGSYPTFSPLPERRTKEDVSKVFLRAITGLETQAVYSLWHYP